MYYPNMQSNCLVLAAVISTIALSGCSSASTATVLSDGCRGAFAKSDADQHALYERDIVGSYLDSIGNPGIDDWTPEKSAGFDAAVAEDNALFEATLAPLFTICGSPAELYAGGQQFPFVFGLTTGTLIDRPTLEIYCRGHEGTAACDGVAEFTP